MTLPLVTLAEAKAFLEIRDTNITRDQFVTALTHLATTEIETAIGLSLSRSEITETFSTLNTITTEYDTYGGSTYDFGSDSGIRRRVNAQVFRLKGLMIDLEEPVEVRYDPARNFEDASILTPEQYRVDALTGFLILYRGTGPFRDALRITYTAGIEPTGTDPAPLTLSDNAPDDLKMACLFQVAFLNKRSRLENVGHNMDRGMVSDNTSFSGLGFNVKQGLCREAQSLVRKYKRMSMAG
jgi:hypothetical protein